MGMSIVVLFPVVSSCDLKAKESEVWNFGNLLASFQTGILCGHFESARDQHLSRNKDVNFLQTTTTTVRNDKDIYNPRKKPYLQSKMIQMSIQKLIDPQNIDSFKKEIRVAKIIHSKTVQKILLVSIFTVTTTIIIIQ